MEEEDIENTKSDDRPNSYSDQILDESSNHYTFIHEENRLRYAGHTPAITPPSTPHRDNNQKNDKNDIFVNQLLLQLSSSSIHESEFPYFKNYDTQSIILHILSYLNAKDLGYLSCTSKSFYYSTLTPKLWKNLLFLDFMLDDEEIIRINDFPNKINLQNENNLKFFYTKHMKDVQNRIKSAKNIKLQIENEQKLERRIQIVESFLDFTSIRIYLPLPAASIFSTLLLIGLRVDGSSLPIWVCLSPILFFLVYTLLLSLITYITFQYRHHPISLIRLLWTNFRGPIHFFYTQIIQESSAAARVALGACVLLLIQILFFGLKTSRSLDQSFHEDFDWGIVFLPIWLLFTLYLTIPFLECARGSLGPFFFLFGLLWIPLFILFVLLTVKLNGGDDKSHDRKIPLSLILIPFWILEGIIMVAGLIGLINGIHRYRKGFLDRDNFLERIGIFSLLWSFFSPIVIFQAFLSTRDDEKSGNHVVGMADTLSPILFMIAFALCLTLILSVKLKTPFQESRHQREMDSAGTRNLFEV